MKKLLKTLSLLVVIGIIGFLLGQNYPNAFRKHTKTTVIQVNPLGKTVTGLDRPLLTGHFFQTQFSIIRSDETILKAINDYRLDKLWNTNKEDLLKEIRGALDLSQVKGSDFIELKTSADDDEKAQQLAYAMVMTFAERKEEAMEERRDEVIKKYNEKITFQENKVKDSRKRLYEISKKLSIPYHGMSTTLLYRTEPESKSDTLEQKYDQQSIQLQEFEIFVKSLQNLNNSALIARMISSSRPEAKRVTKEEKTIRELKESKQNLLANGFGNNHPQVKSLALMIINTEKKLFNYVQDIREKLSNDLVISKQALAELKKNIDIEDLDTLHTAEDHTAFSKVKDEYEREYRILKSLKQADLSQAICHDDHFYPLIKIHEPGWTPEIAKIMKARKK